MVGAEVSLAVMLFFFFKQKTAYEMRISDWSSDVCSSDLRADIVDGAAAGAEAGPGLLPLVLEFEAVAGRTRLQDGDDQHRRRSPDGALRPTQHLAGAGAIEQDAELGDIALRADLLLLDDDTGDDRVEPRIGEIRRLRRGAARGLGPERCPAEALRLPPALEPRFLRGLAAGIDLDAAHLQGAGTVDRRHAPPGALVLFVKGAAPRHGAGAGHTDGGGITSGQSNQPPF